MTILDWTVGAALLDRLMPADEFPSASQAGLIDDLAADAVGEQAETWAVQLGPGFAALADEVAQRGLAPFAELEPAEQDALIADLRDARVSAAWPMDPVRFVDTLIRLVAERYYGARGAPGWAMVGYQPGPRHSSGLTGPQAPGLATKRLGAVRDSYDAIVVGAGAGGGVAASVLTAGGWRVLILERGEDLSYEQIGNDHLRNFRVARYGHNAAPCLEDGVRVVVNPDGSERVEPPWGSDYGALPYVVGGGTRLYQGMAWRLTPEDFHLARTHGVPEGSSLADWPIDYDELEPYYTRVEQEIGVCGDGSAHRNQGRRSADYPMPPLPDNTEAQILRRGAEQLGLTTGPVPMLINSVPRSGRGRCVQCGQCVGFACPADAKNGPYNTMLPAAVAAGCELVTGARVLGVETDMRGQVSGVRAVDQRSGEQRTLRARHVVVAAAAIETARLLLASRSSHHPNGLGNHSDQLGRRKGTSTSVASGCSTSRSSTVRDPTFGSRPATTSTTSRARSGVGYWPTRS